MLCPYDRTRLAPDVIANAERTHPVLITGGRAQPSRAYPQAGLFPADCDRPLPAPPGGAAVLTYRDDLAQVRAFAARHARRAGLPASRTRDLVIAVSELAANTWRHTDATGTLHVWAADGELLCQFHDSGQIRDRWPAAAAPLPAPSTATACGWSTSSVTWSSCAPAAPAPPSACTSGSGPEPAPPGRGRARPAIHCPDVPAK